MDLMEEILADENLQEALRKVCANKGAAGIDGITTTEFHKQMSEEWKETKQRLPWRPQLRARAYNGSRATIRNGHLYDSAAV